MLTIQLIGKNLYYYIENASTSTTESAKLKKKILNQKKVSQSVVDTRNERNYFIWKLASEWKVCIQTFRLVSISIS